MFSKNYFARKKIQIQLKHLHFVLKKHKFFKFISNFIAHQPKAFIIATIQLYKLDGFNKLFEDNFYTKKNCETRFKL